MPRVHHVTKARKDNPVCKAGEPYYWWKFRYGGKHYSLTPPRASQLTQSPFLQGVALMEETIQDYSGSADDLESFRDDLAAQARNLSETSSESFENMPGGLQQGDTGQMLESRRDEMDGVADALEGIDLEFDEDDAKESAKDEFGDNATEAGLSQLIEQAHEDWAVEKQAEIEQAAEYNGE